MEISSVFTGFTLHAVLVNTVQLFYSSKVNTMIDSSPTIVFYSGMYNYAYSTVQVDICAPDWRPIVICFCIRFDQRCRGITLISDPIKFLSVLYNSPRFGPITCWYPVPCHHFHHDSLNLPMSISKLMVFFHLSCTVPEPYIDSKFNQWSITLCV